MDEALAIVTVILAMATTPLTASRLVLRDRSGQVVQAVRRAVNYEAYREVRK